MHLKNGIQTGRVINDFRLKAVISLAMCIIMALAGAGCSGGSGEASGDETGNAKTEAETFDTSKVDVDLTSMSATMVYSEAADMMTTPDNYIGKTIKMNGAFNIYHDEENDQNYYACVIQDATACCSQGLEFELSGNKKYPDDYPEVGEEITVVVEFDTYEDSEYTYCTLRKAVML